MIKQENHGVFDINAPRRKTQEEDAKVKINLKDAEDVVCDECGTGAFLGAVVLKRISPILSPTGEEIMVPIQTFACAQCGHVNDQFLPSNLETNG